MTAIDIEHPSAELAELIRERDLLREEVAKLKANARPIYVLRASGSHHDDPSYDVAFFRSKERADAVAEKWLRVCREKKDKRTWFEVIVFAPSEEVDERLDTLDLPDPPLHGFDCS